MGGKGGKEKEKISEKDCVVLPSWKKLLMIIYLYQAVRQDLVYSSEKLYTVLESQIFTAWLLFMSDKVS